MKKLIIALSLIQASALFGVDLSQELYEAVRRGHTQEATALLSTPGIDVNYINRRTGMTPLHWAVYQGDLALIDSLLAKGADMTEEKFSRSPWFYAVGSDCPQAVQKEVLKTFLAHKPTIINKRDSVGRTGVHCVVGNKELLSLFLEKGADINIPDRWDVTPLATVADWGYEYSVGELLKYAAGTEK